MVCVCEDKSFQHKLTPYIVTCILFIYKGWCDCSELYNDEQGDVTFSVANNSMKEKAIQKYTENSR